MERVIVVGAGMGGLSTAAVLAKAGFDVTVLEAHVYPGGCAGTFFHQGYRFDAGATLAGGFYPCGPMDKLASAAGVYAWPVLPVDPAMIVHLPDGAQAVRWSDERRWDSRREVFGEDSGRFFRWQERTADALWDLALRGLPWPPQTPVQALSLFREGMDWLRTSSNPGIWPGLAADAFRPLSTRLRGASQRLRMFVDAQLLISAQTTSRYANALYAASALDLPRRGVVHVRGGMGALAETLVETIRSHGGRVRYRNQVTAIRIKHHKPARIEVRRGEPYEADLVVVNLPPWNLSQILESGTPPKKGQEPLHPRDAWGAFTLYIGLDESAIPVDFPLHHQVIVREPLGEGNTVFLSLSSPSDEDRAPLGRRALTISTHTQIDPWWELYHGDRQAYEGCKASYQLRVLAAAERVLPGLREAAELILPGTPVTFQRFTRRARGWVGGYPQTHLFRTRGPRLGQNLWMVGDSIFPGQSTAAVALGGLRVAKDILASWGARSHRVPAVNFHWKSQKLLHLKD
jgi:C-3',4' desaturase CrtD